MSANDKAVTIRITSEQYELLQTLAEDNHTSVSTMIGAFCDSCCQIIEAEEDEISLPKYLALCRLNRHYHKNKGPKIT